MSTTTEVRGRVQYDPTETQQRIRGKLDQVLDKGEAISKAASKTASVAFVPVVFDGIASVMRSFYVPEIICKAFSSYGSQKVLDNSDAAAHCCANTTNKVAKQAFGKSADVSVTGSFSIYNWMSSWY